MLNDIHNYSMHICLLLIYVYLLLLNRKRQPIKSKKSPVGSWRSFFNLGKSSSMSKRKLHRNPSEPNELKSMALAGGRGDTGTLRSAKSEESLSSLHNVEGKSTHMALLTFI